MRNEGEAEEARLSSLIPQPSSRLSRYGPLLLWVGFIFFASTENLSASNTSRFIRPLILWLSPGITEEALLKVHLVVRKAAHFAEYGVLALLAARAFLTSSKLLLRERWAVAALSLVVSCSLLDEFHQSFLAARTGSVYDSLIDVAGGAAALLLVAAWRARGKGGAE